MFTFQHCQLEVIVFYKLVFETVLKSTLQSSSSYQHCQLEITCHRHRRLDFCFHGKGEVHRQEPIQPPDHDNHDDYDDDEKDPGDD